MGFLLTGRCTENNRIVVTDGEQVPDDYEWDD